MAAYVIVSVAPCVPKATPPSENGKLNKKKKHLQRFAKDWGTEGREMQRAITSLPADLGSPPRTPIPQRRDRGWHAAQHPHKSSAAAAPHPPSTIQNLLTQAHSSTTMLAGGAAATSGALLRSRGPANSEFPHFLTPLPPVTAILIGRAPPGRVRRLAAGRSSGHESPGRRREWWLLSCPASSAPFPLPLPFPARHSRLLGLNLSGSRA